MQSILQILKLNEPRAWQMQDARNPGQVRAGVSHSAECIVLNDDGTVDQVGVLKLRGEALIAKAKPGTYTGAFALRADPASRKIEAVLTDLIPMHKGPDGRLVPRPEPKPAAG